MPATLDLSAIHRLRARLLRIGNLNATELMLTWGNIISDDNRRGVMAGLDKDGNPMQRVTYRPVGEPQKKLTDAQRNTTNRRMRIGDFHGRGPAPAGMNNNLTSAEYRKLAGPPLAPRGQFSRVITNLRTGFAPAPAILRENESVYALGYWEEVISRKDKPFLHYHFDGATGGGRKRNVTLPQRDLRGVRPEGMREVRRTLREWAVAAIRNAGPETA